MTEPNKQDLIDAGIEADRLRADPAFANAVLEIRSNKVAELIACDSADMVKNLQLRAEITAIDALCGHIAFAIERGKAEQSKAAGRKGPV